MRAQTADGGIQVERNLVSKSSISGPTARTQLVPRHLRCSVLLQVNLTATMTARCWRPAMNQQPTGVTAEKPNDAVKSIIIIYSSLIVHVHAASSPDHSLAMPINIS